MHHDKENILNNVYVIKCINCVMKHSVDTNQAVWATMVPNTVSTHQIEPSLHH